MKKVLLTAALLASCGSEKTSEIDSNLIGGVKVYRSWYGWVSTGCGSTLIAKRWAVSAAHCFGKNKPRTVKFGLYDRTDSRNGGKPIDEIRVKRIIKHPRWSTDKYDLALIELARPSKFKPKPFGNVTPRDGERLNVFGFGQTSHPGSIPRFLQGAVLKFNARATKNSRPQILRAGAPSRAVCFGDSGGPLIYKGRLIATVTFTVGKCNVSGLGGFTRLDVNWIRRYVN